LMQIWKMLVLVSGNLTRLQIKLWDTVWCTESGLWSLHYMILALLLSWKFNIFVVFCHLNVVLSILWFYHQQQELLMCCSS
jgi:hypothetical protein